MMMEGADQERRSLNLPLVSFRSKMGSLRQKSRVSAKVKKRGREEERKREKEGPSLYLRARRGSWLPGRTTCCAAANRDALQMKSSMAILPATENGTIGNAMLHPKEQ